MHPVASGGVSTSDLSPVVFDIGNVLIHWDPHPAVAAAVGPERARAFLDDPEFDFAAWNHAMDAGATSWAEAEASAIDRCPQWREEILSYRANFRRSLSGGLEDSHTIIGELRAADVPLYGLTNWSAELFPIGYEVLPVLQQLDDIIVSGIERVAKPDPQIWRVLASRTGRPPHDLVFTDDSPVNIASAAAVGIDAIRFENPNQLRAELRTRGYPLSPGQQS